MAIVDEIKTVITPATAEKFFKDAKPKPVGETVKYVGTVAIATLLGWLLLYMGYGGGQMGMGLKVAIGQYIMIIVAVVGTGYVLSMVGESVAKRKVTPEEGVMIVGYAMTPALLAGILYAVSWQAGALVSIAGLYSLYMLYVASKARFGAENAVVTVVAVIVGAIVVGVIVSAILSALGLGLGGNLGYGGLGGGSGTYTFNSPKGTFTWSY